MNALDEFGILVDGYVINQCILEAGRRRCGVYHRNLQVTVGKKLGYK